MINRLTLSDTLTSAAPSATDSQLMERLASLDTEDTRLLRTHSDPEEVSETHGIRHSLSLVI